MIQTWSETLALTFQNVGGELLMFIPKLFLAIVIFIAGWVVGSLVGGVVAQIVKALKVDKALESIGTEDLLGRAGYRLDAGAFLGGLIKWFVIVVFLVASVDVLGLLQVNAFLSEVVLGYLPSVIAAALVLLLGAVIADAMQRVVSGAMKAASMPSAHFVAGVTKWAIWIFAILVAISQMGIATEFIRVLFIGVVAALSLACGLAFGLGGKEVAAKYLEKLRKDISER